MSSRRFWTIARIALIALALGGAVTLADAQTATEGVPTNAYAVDNLVGKAWRCEYGYRDNGRNGCNVVIVPANAYLEASGRRWNCLRGYRRVGEVCDRIDLPANGYLSNFSDDPGWKCERGYRVVGARCERVDVPANAYLEPGSYGSGWKCERGYRIDGGSCLKVEPPRHGYIVESAYGSGWKCNRGYMINGETCLVVEVPKNAHLDRSGNSWVCNPPHLRESGTCVRELR